MNKKFFILFSAFVVVILIMVIFTNKRQINEYETNIVLEMNNLGNGDAKFYKDKIITSLGSKLAMIDADTKEKYIYENISANWVDVIEKENLIVYGNFNNEIGMLKLDENHKVIENKILFFDEMLKIDPTILKINDEYYLTYTEIKGNINNADANEENGIYTIKMYQSKNLENWHHVSDIISEQHNLEDVEINYFNDKIVVVYEKEQVDKGKSGIYLKTSTDKGLGWSEEKELLCSDSDHEPTKLDMNSDGTYVLYYSCDKDELGKSYLGAKAYMSIYNENFENIQKDILIKTQTHQGILLYDVETNFNTIKLLYARNYSTDSDLCIEKN